MIPMDDMKYCIQEWMAQCLTAKETAYQYAELRGELDKQMEYMMDSFVKPVELG